MRKAFSMITAIVVIVIMATIAGFVMNLSGKSVHSTTAQYQRAQAMLYAKSYTEFAIMAVTGHDRTVNCVNQITGVIGDDPSSGNGYNINTSISYIVSIKEQGYCARLNTIDIKRKNTPLTIIVDVYVTYKNPNNTTGPLLTVHRRTVQKI